MSFSLPRSQLRQQLARLGQHAVEQAEPINQWNNSTLVKIVPEFEHRFKQMADLLLEQTLQSSRNTERKLQELESRIEYFSRAVPASESHLLTAPAPSNMYLATNPFKAERRTYTCFYLLVSVSLLFICSFVVSVCWSVIREDVSGGFTMGSYIIAVPGVAIAIVGYLHREHCQCWKRRKVSLV
ncbi:uncharacterized protein F4822DRAFT_399098 [Hypoxylon trugodes]|uniref:uncharacterized protein n=1 Tax=Hypoxylon trugodes TaxID=326681 RepID=UPI002199C925|nr:uncharacterized protein F4822DRAFT_399098 [Hypoxylon trugodes]KAI1389648.1 hypothetical protein F4822DRAFT_399098 [Hypoxylon trugodes]